ncbi:MAG: hypothetical protein E7348_04605 [Clostridiales bacterium]|nr:hypothetical protein [Clostridiales bacterium]
MSNQFNFKYTALSQEERKEIDSIRRQYCPSEQKESKLDRLRRLDARVKNSATIVSLVLGVLGLLTFGLGLTTILEWNNLPLGIIIMLVGSVPIALAYPVYLKILNKNKKRYGQEILSLSEELLNQNQDN